MMRHNAVSVELSNLLGHLTLGAFPRRVTYLPSGPRTHEGDKTILYFWSEPEIVDKFVATENPHVPLDATAFDARPYLLEKKVIKDMPFSSVSAA